MEEFLSHAASCIFAVCVAAVTITALLTGHDGNIIFTGLGIIGALGGVHMATVKPAPSKAEKA